MLFAFRAEELSSALLLKPILIFILLLSFVFPGCARLPDYATPAIRSNKTPLSSSFPYRILKRSDFQATSPGEDIQEAEKHLNARSSISIRPKKTTRFLINRSIYNGIPLYFATVEELSFEAVFLPEKSWWNPMVPDNKLSYVLQHEQIHFALMELTARRITKEKAHFREGLPIIEYTSDEAQKKLVEWTKDIINSYQDEIIKEHTEFDNDTSLFYSPKFQKRWWLDITSRLQTQ